MFYRHKLLLELIRAFDSKLTSTKIHKLMLIFSFAQDKPNYWFVPHKYGAYSFVIKSDLKQLEKKELLEKDEHDSKMWTLKTKDSFELKRKDQDIICRLAKTFTDVEELEIVKETYKAYPDYAVNSVIAEKILSDLEMSKVNATRFHSEEPAIFGIGYEGISLDAFILKLIKNDIRHLCDVRKNSYSIKFGFKKHILKEALNDVGISYSHHPELGIESQKRNQAKETGEWDKLFEDYEGHLNQHANKLLDPLLSEFQNKKRIALMCFEHDVCECHRSKIMDLLKTMTEVEVSNL